MASSSTVSPQPRPAPSAFPAPTIPDRDHPLDTETVAYRVVGDGRLTLVLVSGLIMQTAHPVVNAGVDEHSYYATQPWKRLFTSLMPILGCVYDGLDAQETGRRVREAHRGIKGVTADGRKYHAMDPDAYRWVWATIFDAVVRMQDLFGTPLTTDERHRFFHEWRYVGLTMGLRPQDMPGDLDVFYDYYDRMVLDRLEIGIVPRTTLTILHDAPPPPGWPLGRPTWKALWPPLRRVADRATRASIPEPVRRDLGLDWTGRDVLELAVYAAIIRAVFAILPQRHLVLPPRLRRHPARRARRPTVVVLFERNHDMTTDRPHAIVIGAGIGGTALTALLAHAGLRVTLLEKNRHLGCACAGYEKQGFSIDFGTHMFTRGERGPLGQVLTRVGRPGAIEFRTTRDIAEIRWPAAGGPAPYSSVPLPSRIHRYPMFAARMVREMGLTPVEVAQTVRMMTRLLTISDEEADRWLHRDVTEFIAQYTRNPRLATIFCFLLGLYFVIEPQRVSAGEAIYCFKRMILDNNLSYPKGGSSAIPETYCRIATEHGAEIRTNAEVKRIVSKDGSARGVELADGTVLDADMVISTSSVRSTALYLCEPGALPQQYVEAAKAIKGSVIAVQAKFALDRKLVDTGCLIGGFGESGDLLHADADLLNSAMADVYGGRIPDALLFYCPVPSNFDPDLAPPGHQLLTACAVAPTTDVQLQDPARRWEEAIHDKLRRIVPGLDAHTLFVDRTTTHWMEHWNGKEFGPAISTAQTPDQVGRYRPSVDTPIDGLYLAGCGAGGRGVGTELAADSAMECAERILADLRRTQPLSWNTRRHAAPTLAGSLGSAALRVARPPRA
ncbi:oxygenase MpaB family protein [Nocardia sp. NPDC055029]